MGGDIVMQPGTTNDELVRRAKAGDLSAFEELVSRHDRQIYSLAPNSVISSLLYLLDAS